MGIWKKAGGRGERGVSKNAAPACYCSYLARVAALEGLEVVHEVLDSPEDVSVVSRPRLSSCRQQSPSQRLGATGRAFESP